ncbi:hypothetical protein LPW26_18120 [Rhodopseudomonas sp. HC1]|uniref:hypothetical protein n=1 Tax=Rhodopseudomonas infernalis TaxID=2897386 RepID=UPI001EE790E4|nr:hypothetical protein [Rhodopseudomonas infernalis]MCG6206569.1 hypothetical protein [Rhodopseudomonas infernalis]
MSSRMTKIAGAAAAALLAAAAQGQTDTRGNAMGSQNVGNGGMQRGTMAPALGTTTGAAGSMNGENHPMPSSTQGDVGPGGNNNGTLTGPAR